MPDVGMFASFDPVALDVACADAVNRQPIIQNSLLGEVTTRDTITSGLSHREQTG